MRNLRYMCAQPSSPYYLWQVETVIHNFAKHGINPNNLDIVCAIPPGGSAPEKWRKLADTYNTVRFFFIEDDRKDTPYVSSVRPNILKKHFAAHPEMTDEAIFYFDCDMIFTRPPDFSKFVDDDVWYGSDCQFYLGSEYVKGKGQYMYDKMCEIVGIHPTIPVYNELNSIGAQYIMKNIDSVFWEKVEIDSDNLYRWFPEDLEVHPEVLEKDATPENPARHVIQKFTADMWGVLWNGYLRAEVRVDPYFEFCWATQTKEKWDDCVIFHGAGVLNTQNKEYFYKGDYVSGDKMPYNIENHVDPKQAAHYWLKEILETGEKTCLK